MMTTDRRTFLRFLSSAALTAALPQSIERALAIPAHHRTGTIEDVEHIVFLMQENRAFDHYFGTLRGVRGYGDPRAVVLPSGKPVWYPARRQWLRLAVSSHRRQSRAPVPGRHPARLDRHACGMERRQIRPVGPEQGAHDDGASGAARYPLSLCPRGRVHDLRCLSLLAAGSDRSQPLPHVDRLGRQRRRRRRSRHQQCRGRV
mgnify:CR=1 FL=1